MGFAYFPHGAHEDTDELEPGITQTGSACTEDFTCPTPRYYRGTEFLGEDGTDDFGLGECRIVCERLSWSHSGFDLMSDISSCVLYRRLRAGILQPHSRLVRSRLLLY